MSATPSSPPETTSFGFETVAAAEKAGRVRAVFDAVAERYDLMNDLMSGGLHRAWKDAAIAALNPQPGQLLLDVAGGTGDLSRRFAALAEAARARRGGEPARTLIIDINHAMLKAGATRDGDRFQRVCADAEKLPLPDACADAYVIAFGIRNVTHIDRALEEARRVLKPGGRFACLEFSKPTNGALEAVYDAFSFKVIPPMGRLVAGDAQPYQYLVESIRRFPDQTRFKAMVEAAGFSRVRVENFAGGVCALHLGWAI
jgi:demethylmenaquinone methyltransferase/2-methoxy-6-polyprenyl-1,4-benzoquinol methylase